MTVTYYDSTAFAANVPYSVRFSPGNNGDALLDGGELMTVTVRVSDIEAVAGRTCCCPAKAGPWSCTSRRPRAWSSRARSRRFCRR